MSRERNCKECGLPELDCPGCWPRDLSHQHPTKTARKNADLIVQVMEETRNPQQDMFRTPPPPHLLGLEKAKKGVWGEDLVESSRIHNTLLAYVLRKDMIGWVLFVGKVREFALNLNHGEWLSMKLAEAEAINLPEAIERNLQRFTLDLLGDDED